MEQFYDVLEIINYVVIAIASVGFFSQALFIILCFVPKKTYPKAKKNHRIAVIIPAHNESDVIGKTVSSLIEKSTYPKEYFDIFVCADNCTDDTAALAKQAGADFILERHDKNPRHAMACYPIALLINNILTEHKGEYDAVIKLDADNLVCPEFLEKMNDAIDAGVQIGKSYEASSNLTQNIWTKVSGTYYIRDSRIPGRVRQFFHMDQILSGAGMMVATSVLEQIGGWDAMSSSDDIDFSMRRLNEGRRVKYIEDAVVYEDQPSNLKDTFFRLSRMAHGIHNLFWRNLPKLFINFFKTGRLSYLDYILTEIFIPIAVLACCWFPAYYIFYVIVNGLQGFFGVDVDLYQSMADPVLYAQQQIISLGWMILWVVVGYIVIFSGQTFLAVSLDHKKLGLKWTCKGCLSGIMASPLFMIVYAIAICYGVFAKPKWRKLKRSVSKS